MNNIKTECVKHGCSLMVCELFPFHLLIMLQRDGNPLGSGKYDQMDILVSDNEFLNSIIDACHEGIWVIDRDNRTIFVNKRLSEMLGYQQEEILCRSPFSFLDKEGRLILTRHLENVLNGNRGKFELKYTRMDGAGLWTSVSAVPLNNEGSEPGAVLAMLTDITELITTRMKVEKELRVRETQLDSFFANSPVILNLVDENFCYINSDNLTPTYYGLDRDSIRGKCVPDLSPDFIGQTGESMRRVLETGESIVNAQFQSPVPGREGETGYWNTSFFRVSLGDNKWGVGVISTEVTDIKHSEARLQESEERFRTLADNISQLSWMADVSGSVFWYNKRWYDYTGTTFDEMKGWGWRKVHHPDYLARAERKFIEAIETGEPWEDTFPLRRKDGSFRWFLSRALPIRDENNNIVRWFGTNTDITGQKQTEEKLYEALLQAEGSRNTLKALMEYIPMGITISAAPDVSILMVSRYGQDLIERSDIEIIGIPSPQHPSVWGAYHSDGVTPGTPEELPLSRATMKGEVVKNEEWYITRKDGTLIPILCNAAPILDKSGKVTGGVIGWQDIGELKRIQKEMQHRNEELTRFIYTVSHDLKSPLITIRMFTSNLKNDIKEQNVDAQNEDIRFIENAAIKMERLLGELLELSRVGRKEQFKTKVMLETVAKSAIDIVAGSIREKNVEVVITAPPVILYGFSQRLIQLYQNLLDNAIKFMGDQPSPRIEIGAFEDNKKQVILFVSDNGIGIDNQYQDKVFGLFEKLDPATDGTGIGLAIVKRVIEVHDGRIWFSSPGQDKGTTFFFTIDKAKILNQEK